MLRLNVSKVKSYWKERGAFGLIKRVILRIINPFFSYCPLNFYVISSLPQIQQQPRCSLEFRQGSRADTDLIVRLIKDRDESYVRERVKFLFDNGGKVFLAFSEGKLVHTAWLHYCPGVCRTHPHVTIKEDEAFMGHCYTHPEFRGKNILTVALQHLVKCAAIDNKHRCIGTTVPQNIPAIRGIEKAGLSFVGKMRRFRLFGKMLNNQWDSSRLSGPE
jgi:RimJ/RimL family protein N-acetyltransferase